MPGPVRVTLAPMPTATVKNASNQSGGIWTVTHRVLKAFEAQGAWRGTGELLDASAWRTVKSLVEQRHLAPVDPRDISPFTDEDGRLWVDEDSYLAHLVRVSADTNI